MDNNDLVKEWAGELSGILGRSVADIQERGLNAHDFPNDYDLCVEFMDGSRLECKYAFYAIREASHQMAIFSEHCGYHVFPLHGATITHIHRDWQYSSDS